MTRISAYLCPSDSLRLATSPVIADSTVASNYAGNAGADTFTTNGRFVREALRPAQFRDGLSTTVGVAEWIVGPEPQERRSARLAPYPAAIGSEARSGISEPLCGTSRRSDSRPCSPDSRGNTG